jgi:putative oxidoreductase
MRKLLFLSSAQRFQNAALLLLRVFVGVYLIWGVWDNFTSHERMQEYAAFLAQHHFPNPTVFAPLSVYLQLLIGLAFILGLFTRWAGLLCALHFAIAIAMVDRHGGMRGIFPSGCLVGLGLYLATHGAGLISIDTALRANDLPRARGGGVRLKK